MKFSDQVKEDVKVSAKCMQADMQVQGKAAPTREQQLQKVATQKAKTAQQNQVKRRAESRRIQRLQICI